MEGNSAHATTAKGPAELRPNVVLNRRYRLEKRIRASAEGDVFLAYDALLHRSVTVEVPTVSRDASYGYNEVFLYRRQVSSALHHRNILATMDIGEDHGQPYVVSEYFVGEPLRTIIEDEAPFDIDDVSILIEQLAQGLDHAHMRGIVHGNLSPEAVVIDATGLAKLTNLGMVEGQMVSESGNRSGVEAGPYLPANLRGNSLVTQALDVHALASIAYEMLVGHPPSGNQRYQSPSADNPAVPQRAGETVLFGLLAYENRTGLTAHQFSHALTNWRSWANQSIPAESPPSRASSYRTSNSGERSMPATSWPASQLPTGTQSPSNRNIQSPNPQRGSRAVRWLCLAVLILSVVASVAIFQEDLPQTVSTVTELPSELDQLLSATSE